MKIAFWSNGNGKSGVTSNMIAVALMTAVQYQFKIVMLQSGFNLNSLDYAFADYAQIQAIRENSFCHPIKGIDYFLKKYRQNALNEDAVINQGMERLLEKAYYIPATEHASREVFEDSMVKSIKEILDRIHKAADIIFVDAGSGMGELSKKILEAADLIVVNTVQETNELEKFFFRYQEYIKKSVYLISFYHCNSNCNLKKIQKIFRIEKRQIAAVPYNVMFYDAVSKGKAVKYLADHYQCREFDQNFYFMKEIKAASKMILQRAGILN